MKLLQWLLYWGTFGMARHPNAPKDAEPLLAAHAFMLNYVLPFEAMYVRDGREFYRVYDWHRFSAELYTVCDVDGGAHGVSMTADVWCVLRPKVVQS